MKQYRDKISLIGKDGQGKKLSEEETMNYVKLHCASLKKQEDYDILAERVNFDIEKAA